MNEPIADPSSTTSSKSRHSPSFIGSDEKIINHQDVHARQLVEQLGIRARRRGRLRVGEGAGRTDAQYTATLTAGGLGESRTEIAFTPRPFFRPR